jgi:hypothetical protein
VGEKPPSISEFILAVCSGWVSLMAGILGIALWAFAAVLEPMPVSLRWSFLVCGSIALVVASFQAWKKERLEKNKALATLTPKIEILDETKQERGFCRILVRNLCDLDLHFGVQVEQLNPSMPGLPEMLQLQISHDPGQPLGILPGRTTRAVDVFCLHPIESSIQLVGATNKPTIPKRRHEITVLAHCGQGPPVRAVFILDPKDGAAEFRKVVTV